MRPWLLASLSLAFASSCAAREVLPSPTLPADRDAPESPPNANDTQREVAEMLAKVEAAMAPICEDQCGTVGAVPDLDISAGAGTIPSVSGYASLVLYRPDGSCVRETAEARFYCMAHEYGHHLDVAMSKRRSNHDWAGELRADGLAGCAVSRASISLERLRARFDAWQAAEQGRFARACGTDDSHPALEWTWQAIQAGATVCSRPAPSKAAILAAVEPIVQRAHEEARRERKRLGNSMRGSEPCLAPLR